MSSAVQHVAKTDPTLRAVISAVGALPVLPPSHGVFHDLVSCLADHQVPQRSRRGVYLKKIVRLLDGALPDPHNVLGIDEADWNHAKLANRKYHYLRGLAERWIANAYDKVDWPDLPETTVREILSGIKGIGPNAVDMVLLYTLERPDIFPPHDSQVRQIMEQLYELDPKPPKEFTEKIRTLSTAWAPHRSTAVRYLIAYRHLLRKK